MTSREALEQDKKGEFYADPAYDGDESGDWGVFGTESGFCYSTWSSKEEAEQAARKKGNA